MVVCSLVVEVGTLAEDVGGVVVEAKVVIVSVACSVRQRRGYISDGYNPMLN